MRAREQAELFENETTHVGARYQTFRRSFEEICAGEDAWIPLGKFMHQFFGEYKEYRELLLQDPLQLPEHITTEQLRWAVFCSASVEYLCTTYEIPCPEWVHDPHYLLKEPWFYGIGSDRQHVQEKLRQTTPEAFTKRNIFCGDRTFRNKYERQERLGHLRTA